MMKSLLKLATVVSIAGAIAISPIANLKAHALTEAQAIERLNGIPIFTITDDKGAPLLGSLAQQAGRKPEDPDQLMLFFLSPDDAQAMLNQLKASNPSVGGKAKISTGSMFQAIKLAEQNKGKKVAFQFVPSKASIDSARNLLSAQGKPADQIPNVPVFYATGAQGNGQGLLTLEQNGKQVVPFFFDQKDLQGLIDRARQQQPDVAKDTKIQVTSLFQVLDSMVTKDNKPNPEADRFEFVPSRSAFEYVLKSQPAPTQPSVTPQPKPKAMLKAN
ncbi:Tic22 family protein [Tumidithrix elongata RA019]|uniref:Tic22 family protein n=1 Tax=Tumidithrix elongata BACA0141 TaxID=2716417 RepID=A0AAW9PW80_9CYAN|nr:Tic22 family protein [Tumidithrix elongata RA019]